MVWIVGVIAMLLFMMIPFFAVWLWILALVRIINGPYSHLEKAALIVLIICLPIVGSILFLVLKDGRRRVPTMT